MNALIVCHAGVGLGLGHLTRSLVVARALHQELGASVDLLIQGNPVRLESLSQFGHQFLRTDENLADTVRHQVKFICPQVVVFDLHPGLVPADFTHLLEVLRQEGCKVIGVDGLLSQRDNLDLIFIPSFRFILPDTIKSSNPILFGWDCFLLNVNGPAIDWKPGRQVLALTGGSDAACLGKTLPKLLNAALPDDTTLNWVCGPFAKQPVWPIAPRFSMLRRNFSFGLGDLMSRANYAVTVYGVSFFELLYYGVPTVVFSPYENRFDSELSAISAEGVARVARDELEAVAMLRELMADDVMAVSISKRARTKLSVLGGTKFAKSVRDLLN